MNKQLILKTLELSNEIAHETVMEYLDDGLSLSDSLEQTALRFGKTSLSSLEDDGWKLKLHQSSLDSVETCCDILRAHLEGLEQTRRWLSPDDDQKTREEELAILLEASKNLTVHIEALRASWKWDQLQQPKSPEPPKQQQVG